jgi:hypothetical protein
MNIEEYLKFVYIEKDIIVNKLPKYNSILDAKMLHNYINPKIICNDGFSISVQGGSWYYSTPKEKTDVYLELEIGFASEKDEIMLNYDETRGYVPINEINECLKRHGGINIQKTFDPFLNKLPEIGHFFFKPNHIYLRKNKLKNILDV